MKVQSEITVYEVNGEEAKTVGDVGLIVESHWNRKDFVRLKWLNSDKVLTVLAADLERAIANAQNHK